MEINEWGSGVTLQWPARQKESHWWATSLPDLITLLITFNLVLFVFYLNSFIICILFKFNSNCLLLWRFTEVNNINYCTRDVALLRCGTQGNYYLRIVIDSEKVSGIQQSGDPEWNFLGIVNLLKRTHSHSIESIPSYLQTALLSTPPKLNLLLFVPASDEPISHVCTALLP